MQRLWPLCRRSSPQCAPHAQRQREDKDHKFAMSVLPHQSWTLASSASSAVEKRPRVICTSPLGQASRTLPDLQMMLPDRPLVLLRQVFSCFAKARTLWSMDVNGCQWDTQSTRTKTLKHKASVLADQSCALARWKALKNIVSSKFHSVESSLLAIILNSSPWFRLIKKSRYIYVIGRHKQLCQAEHKAL